MSAKAHPAHTCNYYYTRNVQKSKPLFDLTNTNRRYRSQIHEQGTDFIINYDIKYRLGGAAESK